MATTLTRRLRTDHAAPAFATELFCAGARPSCKLIGAFLLALVLSPVPALAQEAAAGDRDGGTSAPSPDGGTPAPSPEDKKLLEEIEAASGKPEAAAPTSPAQPAPPSAAPAARSSSAFSNIFNPAMSANGLLLASQGFAPASARHGSLALQELELQFLSNVDPYFSANLILTLPSGQSLGVEEAYLSAIPQVAGISLRAGMIKVPFGRENATHTHALPFIDKSLVGTAILGEEGLDDVGVEGTALLPLPWYSLLTVTVMDGRDQVLLGSPDGSKLAGFGGLRNVFDVTDDSTLEAGLSYAAGRGVDEQLAQAFGAHLIYKWKPARDATNSSAVVALEGIVARQPTYTMDDLHDLVRTDTAGFYGYVQWQLTRGWYLGGRAEWLTHPAIESDVTTRQSAILAFAPTEFSAFRLQLNATEPPSGPQPVIEAFLQANFTIGAHPAHAY